MMLMVWLMSPLASLMPTMLGMRESSTTVPTSMLRPVRMGML